MSNWGPYWDLQRHVLVEKSPRHVLMTRYFQQIFTPERSFFIIILRHPLGAMHMYTEPAACMRLSEYLRHWFAIHNTVVADIRHLKHAVVVQYDVLVNANRTFSVLDGLERAMGVSGGFNVSFGEFDPNKVYKPELNLTGLPPHLRSAALQMIQRRQEYAQFMAGRQLDRPAYTGASRPSSAVASPNMLNHLRITLKQVEGAHGPNASITQRLRAHLQRLEAAAADEERRHRREEVVQHGTELPVAGSERSATGRRLLEYRSDTRNGVVINRGMEHSWVPKFTRVYGEDLRAKCASVVEAYEERLLQFGYSLLDFSAVRRPTIFGSHVLGWDDELAAEAVVEAAMEPAAEAAAAAENP